MKAPMQIPKPRNWQDFEELCLRVWKEEWQCRNAQRNGRQGQAQCGVDIYGRPKDESGYYGVQCKGKDDWSSAELTSTEIDIEIEKAKSFSPTLKSYIIATTANKDTNIQKYACNKDIELIKGNFFDFAVYCWEDIVSLIEQYKNVYEWYVYNKMKMFEPDIDVVVNCKIGEENDPIILQPKYIKKFQLKVIRNQVIMTKFLQCQIFQIFSKK